MDQRLPEAAVTDWRGLCEELVRELENTIAVHYGEGGTHHISAADAVIARADAALAQPEPEVRPTDEELLSLDQLRDAWNAQADAANGWDELGIDEIIWWAQRQALSLRGRPAPAPAEGELGELGELVAWFCEEAVQAANSDAPRSAGMLTWAAQVVGEHADLLERQAAPVPVAVSERLPGDQLCWWFEADEDCGYGSNWTLLRIRGSATGYTHWLPAHALPLPSGEVEHG